MPRARKRTLAMEKTSARVRAMRPRVITGATSLRRRPPRRSEVAPVITLGRIALTLALVFSMASVLFLALGMRWDRKDLLRNGYYAVYAFFLTTVVASAVLLQAFLKKDFSFGYVVENSDASLSTFYRIAGFWAGQQERALLTRPEARDAVEGRQTGVGVLDDVAETEVLLEEGLQQHGAGDDGRQEERIDRIVTVSEHVLAVPAHAESEEPYGTEGEDERSYERVLTECYHRLGLTAPRPAWAQWRSVPCTCSGTWSGAGRR